MTLRIFQDAWRKCISNLRNRSLWRPGFRSLSCDAKSGREAICCFATRSCQSTSSQLTCFQLAVLQGPVGNLALHVLLFGCSARRVFVQVRSGMETYAGAARRRVHLTTVLLRPPSGRRQPRHVHILQIGLHLTQP